MAITILAPKPAAPVSIRRALDTTTTSNEPHFLQLSQRAKHNQDSQVFTPGETITTDPQWMRGHGTTTNPSFDTTNPPITSTVAGTLTKTNKLLSVTPLHARYSPSIGDLVVGRVVNISATGKRWNVDIAAPLLASLPLSAINLPGGVLRRRTAVDELNVRGFFAEGDLVVAEVQDVRNDGSASLHTRSLRYGKLRNGVFLAVRSEGAGAREGGVVRSRRQISTIETQGGGGKVDVILGVNGYVFVCAHTDIEAGQDASGGGFGASNALLEEKASMRMYASANDYIDENTRQEIARLGSVVRLLAEKGVSVDEETVKKGYEIACELEMERMDVDRKGEPDRTFTADMTAQLVEQVLAEGGR